MASNTSPTVPRLMRVESGHRIGGFEPEINRQRNKICDHLRENQATDNDTTKWGSQIS
jgi:hypothetical protein